MIDEQTLFILGAGASKPYGFPTGRELRIQIINSFYQDISNLLPESSIPLKHEKERILRETKLFLDNFSNAPLYSIDQFLSLNPMHRYIGKIAIVYYIRRKEIESKFLEKMPSPAHEEDWYSLIFQRMTAGFNKPQDYAHFKGNKAVFITFNYDRSLEYYLYKSFLNAFWQSRREYESNLAEYIPFPIIHVYGKAGEWGANWEENLEYYREDSITFRNLVELASRIGVIGETSVEDTKGQIAEIVAGCKKIFFCGFGYAEENRDAIGLPGCIDDNWRIFGTAKGMSKREIQSVKQALGKNYKQSLILENWIRLEDKNSYELLREYL